VTVYEQDSSHQDGNEAVQPNGIKRQEIIKVIVKAKIRAIVTVTVSVTLTVQSRHAFIT
jgi:hypothetical protein